MRPPAFVLVFCVIFILMISCSPRSELSSCCQECLTAASQDPSGYDIAIKECSRYSLSEGCTTFFDQNEATVSTCKETIK